ncbi:MAG: S41 family peptidase [Chloroflexi bacterium]|nr:S41 family peptidase [Chloroflexota bacterium]
MNKTVRGFLVAVVALGLLVCAFGGGILAGRLTTSPAATVPPAGSATEPAVTEDITPPGMQELMAPVWETWDIIHEQYYEQPLDDQALVDGMLGGLMDSLPDDHSSYMNPQQTRDANIDMSGEYDGIGAWVDIEGEFLTIVRPIPGYPAEAAGLKTGDQVIAVDGEDVIGLEPALVRLKVMGPAGTEVVLTIVREGVDEPFDVTVTRAHIVIPSVEGRMLDGGIAYIAISVFGDSAGTELRTILSGLLDQGAVGIILDLRNNTGGYTTSATEVASEFIGEGVIWYEAYGDGTRYENEAIPGGLATGDIPLVVLVNEWSASASELVSGAIQDYDRGQLVGVATYGKGSVQNWVPISNGGTVRVTIAKWLTPDGRTIHETGLTPDVIVEMTLEQSEAGLDPQLDKAVLVIHGMLYGGSD